MILSRNARCGDDDSYPGTPEEGGFGMFDTTGNVAQCIDTWLGIKLPDGDSRRELAAN